MRVEQIATNFKDRYNKIKSNREAQRQAIREKDAQLNFVLSGGRDPEQTRYKRAVRFLSIHSNRISSIGYTSGNGYLMAKAGIHLDLDTFAGMCFLPTSVGIDFARKYPTASYRAIGAIGLIGTAALSAKGIHFNTEQAIDWLRVASPIAGFGTGFTLMGLQKEIARAAEKAKDSKNRLKRAFAKTQRYPVALAALIDSVGCTGVGIDAVNNGDMKTLAVTGLWGVGVAALAMSDPRIGKHLQNYSGSSPESIKSKPSEEKQGVSQGGTIFDSRQYNLQF